MWNERQSIEIFHLLFLRAFGGRVDKSLFALKGGSNLRFYFKSIRYSEDMDLDIQTMAVETLRSNVNRLLESHAFVQQLAAQGLELTGATQPKQTTTTQRWKLSLRMTESGTDVPTKIEFSRRGLDAGKAVEPVDSGVIRAYRLFPVIAQHYTLHTALAQKVAALALRGRVQSRDVFDLKFLMDHGGTEQPLPATIAVHLPAAIENALSIEYDAFVGQVVAYLEPEYQKHYKSRQAWSDLRSEVIAGLEALRA